MRIIVHAGMSKTGSSTLQESLGNSRDFLQQQGVIYPSVTDHNNHTHLLPAVLESNEWFRNFGPRTPEQRVKVCDVSELAWMRLRETAANCAEDDTLVLSSEGIFSLRDSSALRLYERLSDISQDIRTVVYIRNPADHFLSAKQQILKFSHTVHDDYVQEYKTILTMLSCSGPLSVRAFGSGNLYRDCIVKDFLASQISMPDEVADAVEVIRSNDSISAEGMILLQHFHSLAFEGPVPFGNGMSKTVLALVQAEEEKTKFTKPKLRSAVFNSITSRHATGLDWLETEFGLRFSGFDRHAVVDDGTWSMRKSVNIKDICEFDPHLLERLETAVFPEGIENWIVTARAAIEKLRKRRMLLSVEN